MEKPKMIVDKVARWRNKRLHRKCIFCTHLGYYYEGRYPYCKAKQKQLSESYPNTLYLPRIFCQLFDLYRGEV